MSATTNVLGQLSTTRDQTMIFGGRKFGTYPHNVGLIFRPYFESHSIMVLTIYLVRQVVNKPEVLGCTTTRSL